jgi:hypothetical protein
MALKKLAMEIMAMLAEKWQHRWENGNGREDVVVSKM